MPGIELLKISRVQSDILHTEPFPKLEISFAIARSEEQRRTTMLNNHVDSSVAMVVKTFLTQNRFVPSKAHGISEDGYTLCGNSKHVVENCFKKNKYPDWWDSFSERKNCEGRDRHRTMEKEKMVKLR